MPLNYDSFAAFLSTRGRGWCLPEVKTFKPSPGQNRIRLLPSMHERKDAFCPILVFQRLGASGVDNYPVLLDPRAGSDSPLYNAYLELIAQYGKEVFFPATRNSGINPYESVLMWALDKKGSGTEPLVYHTSRNNFQIILSLFMEPSSRTFTIDPFDLENGFDFSFNMEQKSKDIRHIRYTAHAFSRNPSPASPDPKAIEWLKGYLREVPIEKVVNLASADEQEREVPRFRKMVETAIQSASDSPYPSQASNPPSRSYGNSSGSGSHFREEDVPDFPPVPHKEEAAPGTVNSTLSRLHAIREAAAKFK